VKVSFSEGSGIFRHSENLKEEVEIKIGKIEKLL